MNHPESCGTVLEWVKGNIKADKWFLAHLHLLRYCCCYRKCKKKRPRNPPPPPQTQFCNDCKVRSVLPPIPAQISACPRKPHRDAGTRAGHASQLTPSLPFPLIRSTGHPTPVISEVDRGGVGESLAHQRKPRGAFRAWHVFFYFNEKAQNILLSVFQLCRWINYAPQRQQYERALWSSFYMSILYIKHRSCLDLTVLIKEVWNLIQTSIKLDTQWICLISTEQEIDFEMDLQPQNA